ncbi:MAG: response regulator transcription factor [Verrucomicrobium sp.]
MTAGLYPASQERGPLAAIVGYLAHLLPGAQVIASMSSTRGTDFALTETAAEGRFKETLHGLNGGMQQGERWLYSDATERQIWHPAAWPKAALASLRLGKAEAKPGEGAAEAQIFHACVVLEQRGLTPLEKTLLDLSRPHFRTLIRLFAPAPVPGPAKLVELGLTPRERDVLYWVSEGKTNAEIGTILNVSSGTVRVHLENIYPKLGVENRISASRVALEKLHPSRFPMKSHS